MVFYYGFCAHSVLRIFVVSMVFTSQLGKEDGNANKLKYWTVQKFAIAGGLPIEFIFRHKIAT